MLAFQAGGWTSSSRNRVGDDALWQRCQVVEEPRMDGPSSLDSHLLRHPRRCTEDQTSLSFWWRGGPFHL